MRDAIGFAADSFMDPLSCFVTPLGVDFGRAAGNRVNERAQNMKLYDDVEDTSLDLYAAVRNGYLERRQKSIKDAIRPSLPSARRWRKMTPINPGNVRAPAKLPVRSSELPEPVTDRLVG